MTRNNETAHNIGKGFVASVAGRKINQQFCKFQQWFGLDKLLSTSNLNFNEIIISSGCGQDGVLNSKLLLLFMRFLF